jgi:hypothetical protein
LDIGFCSSAVHEQPCQSAWRVRGLFHSTMAGYKGHWSRGRRSIRGGKLTALGRNRRTAFGLRCVFEGSHRATKRAGSRRRTSGRAGPDGGPPKGQQHRLLKVVRSDQNHALQDS